MKQKPNEKLKQLEQFQVTDQDQPLTTNQGLKISNDEHSLKLGERGPTLLEDFHLREKITHFDHERIPERVVHARGSAAHGVFESYNDFSHLTRAKFLSEKGKQTPVFVRFSCAFLQWPVIAGRWILLEMRAALRPSSIQKKVTTI